MNIAVGTAPKNLRQTLSGIASAFSEEHKHVCSGILLTGSVSYGRDEVVTEKSDIDLLMIVPDFGAALEAFFEKSEVRILDDSRYFEGCAPAYQYRGQKMSLHILREDAIELIARTYVGELRMFRRGGKSTNYSLGGFYGERYEFKPTNIKLDDCKGFRTIIPIGFINEDKYYIGVHRDKLIANPHILHGHQFLNPLLDKHWNKLADIYKRERSRNPGQISFVKSLVKFDKFSMETIEYIESRLKFLGCSAA